MFCWTMIFSLLLVLAAVNLSSSSSSISKNNNYLEKVIIERNGKKFVNLFAFPQVKITLETTNEKDFNFQMKDVCDITPIKFGFSTTRSAQVNCDANLSSLDCKYLSVPIIFLPLSGDHLVDLYTSYHRQGANLYFLKEGSKFVLKISSEYTPPSAENFDVCPFTMEWPSSVTFQETSPANEPPPSPEIPSDYEICDEMPEESEEKCGALKNETGVKFTSKGALEFLFATVNTNKSYEILFSSDEYSPIFTISGTPACSKYKVKLVFGKSDYILFDRKNEHVEIQLNFPPYSKTIQSDKNPISKDSNVQFYFYQNFLFCYFFDPQENFQLRTLRLPEGTAEKMKNSTKIQIEPVLTNRECHAVNKLNIVGNMVKLIVSKLVKPTLLPTPPSPTAQSLNQTTPKAAGKKDESAESSFPLVAIILISCFGGLLLLCAIIFVIYCCITKCKKRKQPKTPPTMLLDQSMSMMEVQNDAISKKTKKKNKIDGPGKKAAKEEEKIPIIIGATTAELAPPPKKSDDEKALPMAQAKNDVKEQKQDGVDGAAAKIEETEDEIPAPVHVKPPPPPLTMAKPDYNHPVRFDKAFVRSVLPASVFAAEKYYEENPIEDDKINWELVPQNVQLCESSNFWDLFPFLKAERECYIESSNPKKRPFQYQFVIRDLSLPENKIFHKFGNRLAEPVAEEKLIEEKVVEEKVTEGKVTEEEGVEEEGVEKAKPILIKTFILSHDPPTIECIVHRNRIPSFFFYCTDCRLDCRNSKVRYFSSPSDLSTCLREFPLGHHVLTAIGDDRSIKKTENRKIIFSVKGGRQTIPVNIKFGAFAHRNLVHIEKAKKKKQKKASKTKTTKTTAKTDEEQMIATLNSGENKNKKKTGGGKKTNTLDGDATNATDPTQGTIENQLHGTAGTQLSDGTAGTQPSATQNA